VVGAGAGAEGAGADGSGAGGAGAGADGAGAGAVYDGTGTTVELEGGKLIIIVGKGGAGGADDVGITAVLKELDVGNTVGIGPPVMIFSSSSTPTPSLDAASSTLTHVTLKPSLSCKGRAKHLDGALQETARR
jgi:hypothetical protein